LKAQLNDGPQVWFWCAGCETHHAIDPTKWTWNGDTERPTFRPSVLVTYTFGVERTPKRCHSFVTDGHIQYLDDCTHALAGQTVLLEDVEL
jgi:hypothetical protein